MNLQFTVDNQNISFQKPSESVVNDSKNYVKAIFNFSGELWEKNGTKTAIFHQMNKAYSVILTDDWCHVPSEVLKNGSFSVGVMTTYEDDETSKTVYTKACIVDTSPSCYADGFDNGVTPSQYEQIMALFAVGGKGIEVIKVNGTEILMEGKSVNITVPTKISDLENDSNFLTEPEISTLDGTEPVVSAAHNTEIRCTQELASLSLTFPEGYPDDYISCITFKSGVNPTALSYPEGIKWSGDSMSYGEFVPEKNMIYDVLFWYNGFNMNGVVRGIYL